MKSPFPGMDPYLEAYWGDVHISLVTYARDQLREQLPPDLKVRVEPLIVPLEVEAPVERSLHVIDPRSGNRVITTIGFLSPANKSSEEGRRAYRQKQRHLIDGGVNLVEIDLLRGGQYVLAAPEANLPLPYRRPYRVCVVRASTPKRAEVYRVPLEEPLPAIRVPMRPTDEDAALRLQPLVEAAYEQGDYADLDYRRNPEPPLSPAEAAWADELLHRQGRR